MQVVYLLDVAAQKLMLITESTNGADEARLGDVCFSLDSSMLLTAFETADGPLVEVHGCNGQALHVLQPQDARFATTLACLSGNRAVVSCRSSEFTAWDLLTGQQTGTVEVPGPRYYGEDDSDEDFGLDDCDHASRICVNSSASRLVYLGANRTIVHIFDAVSLQALSTIWTAASIGPHANNGLCGLQSGAISFLLKTYPQGGTSAWHLCSLETGTTVFSKNMPCGSAQAPVLSEDDAFAAFVCISTEGQASIQIYETRSGSMVHTRKLGLPRGAEVLRQVYMNWAGCHLLIMARTVQGSPCRLQGRSTSHILLLQFQN